LCLYRSLVSTSFRRNDYGCTAAIQFLVIKPNGETAGWTCASDEDLKRNLGDVGGYALQFRDDDDVKEDVYEFKRLRELQAASAGRKFKVLTKAVLPSPSAGNVTCPWYVAGT